MQIGEWFCDDYIHECGSDFSERTASQKEKVTKDATLGKHQHLTGRSNKEESTEETKKM